MDRDKKPLGARPNGRAPNQLVVKEQGRKPLFANTSNARDAKDKDPDRAQPNTGRFRAGSAGEGLARRSHSESLERSSSSLSSPAGTRIPRPKGASFSNRKPISLKEAFDRAALEEGDESDRSHVMDGSPSPAPRPWRRDKDEKSLRKILNEDHLDNKGPSRPFSRGSLATATLGASPEKNESPRRRTLYGKPRPGLGANKAPKTSRMVNGTKSVEQLSDFGDKLGTGSDWLNRSESKEDLTQEGIIPALVPGIEDLPLPSIESGIQQGINHVENGVQEGIDHVEHPSPEKSFAWQVDQDFTAGDLQVSDSPRIRMDSRPFANRLTFDNDGSAVDINSKGRVNRPGSQNTKLDGIRSREIKEGNDIPVALPRPPRKIDEIPALEEKVEREIPIPDRRLSQRTNTKLSDIQEREILPLSNRRLATTRLDEIRERNAEVRSLSPEEPRPHTSRGRRESNSGAELEVQLPTRPKSAFEVAGERIPDTPVTVYKSRQIKETEAHDEKESYGNNTDDVRPKLSHKREDSRDVLRRLARAASSSPAPESESERPPSPPITGKTLSETTRSRTGAARRISDPNDRMTRNETKDSERSKPTVGFVGIPRNRSSDSVKSKASIQSETDPTDRIEAEMNLFAPADNHSERGSIRAPSPEFDAEDDFDATPKPKRQDPLLMPTPRITGAYVETPATVKVEKKEIRQEGSLRDDLPRRSKSASLSENKPDLAWRSRDKDTASEPETDKKPSPTESSSGVRRRRTRSLPRPKGALRNSAKLPSVKDDLMELQRSHNIEDSTLDDFEEMLKSRKDSSPRLKALLKDIPTKPSDADDDSFDFDLDRDTKTNTKNNKSSINRMDESYHSDSDIMTSDRMKRMSKTLQTGLLGLRTVKKGIERLEDQVSHAEKQSLEKMDTQPPTNDHCTTCTTHPTHSTAPYIQLPLPRLYESTPTFRFTLLGLFLFLLSTWYAAESTMCHFYCRKPTCSSPPCIRSMDDPTFGTAIPVKIDQWTTNGHGRKVANSLLQDTSDWAADLKDLFYGRDITEIDTSGLTFEQKRQHRRRLRKKGLTKPRVETPEQKAKWDAWHRARLAKERAKEAREMGYEVAADDESVGGDERVWP